MQLNGEIRAVKGLSVITCVTSDHCSFVIHLKRTFDFRNHVCMVFEVLGLSVFDYLKNNGFRPFPVEHVRTMARQLLIAIKCMCGGGSFEYGW